MRHVLLSALVAAATALLPQQAQAAWPKEVEVEICWNFVCDGNLAQWTLRRDGTFKDQYGSEGVYFWEGFYPTWPYAEDFLLFYDNGVASYFGVINNGKLEGQMSTSAFYPFYPYPPAPVVLGEFCQGGC